MKRGGIVLAMVVLMVPALALAGPMKDGKHDLSSGSTGPNKSNSQDQLCVFCHIPHNSAPVAGRPLWNHTPTTQALSWNPGTTVRGTVLPTNINGAALGGSLACMSCHDGTVALGDLVSGTGGTVTGASVTGGKLTAGVNYLNPATMEKTHPLGVQKPAPVVGFTGFKTVPAGTAVNYDVAGYVQCGSCHNPHDNTNAPFLKISNAGSAICTTCHDL